MDASSPAGSVTQTRWLRWWSAWGKGVPRAGAALRPEDLAAHLDPLLPAFMRPRYIEMRADLPKTGSSRVRKFLLSADGTAASWERSPRRTTPPSPDRR